MVGRGSRDVCASADMRILSEVVVHGRNAKTNARLADELKLASDALFTTFYAMAEPRLPGTLAAVAQTERFDRILVHPHLLFSGRLYEAIGRQVGEAANRFPDVEFRVSDYLGPTRAVARAIAGRIAQTV
jgi:sirohydrochlorin cobaltochelatase